MFLLHVGNTQITFINNAATISALEAVNAIHPRWTENKYRRKHALLDYDTHCLRVSNTQGWGSFFGRF